VIADNPWIDAVIRMLLVVMLVIGAALILIWLERKVAGRIQQRLGPMVVGPYGLLQSVADAIKLMTKEDLRPASADRWVFELAPFVAFVPSMLVLVSLPFTGDLFVRNLELGLFYIVSVSGLSIVGLLMAGWGSANKYALLGAVRAAAQLISYEIPLVLAILAVAMVSGTLNLVEIVDGQGRVPYIVWQPLGFGIFMIATLAELYRNPFDIPVAESEIVGGPFIEYSGIRWSMFFFAEYINVFALSVLGSLVFLGGWNWPLGNEVGWPLQLVLIFAKTSFMLLTFMWLRVSLPRLRIDQLMSFCWQVLIPFAFAGIIMNGFVLVYEWPDVVLGLFSGAAALMAASAVYYGSRRAVPTQPWTVMTARGIR
jgi:NADH-quinone oxidoreductase subunit H